MSSKLDGLVPPQTLSKFRHALSHETTGTIRTIMQNTGCNMDRAIDSILDLVARGVVRLLLQPNGECMIDLVPNPQEVTEIIVDAEVKRILNGRTTIERDHDRAKGATGKTILEMPKGKLH